MDKGATLKNDRNLKTRTMQILYDLPFIIIFPVRALASSLKGHVCSSGVLQLATVNICLTPQMHSNVYLMYLIYFIHGMLKIA
jgi:hypothetical protein